jgi:prevent-host-death family protein
MDRVGVRELRQNLSVYLRRVERGETLEVTERGRSVALLQPYPVGGDAIDALVSRGVVSGRPRTAIRDVPPPLPPLPGGPSLSEVLAAMRDEDSAR